MKFNFKTNVFKALQKSVQELQGHYAQEPAAEPEMPQPMPTVQEQAAAYYKDKQTLEEFKRQREAMLREMETIEEAQIITETSTQHPVWPVNLGDTNPYGIAEERLTPTTPEPDLYYIPDPEPERTVEEVYQLPPTLDIYVGDNQVGKQYGILGKTAEYEQKIALDLNGTNTISLFGVQGAGKSYSIGTVMEMTLRQFQNVNYLSHPLAGVIFHYSESEDYKPEFTSMIYPNTKPDEVNKLRQGYQAQPDRVRDIVLLVPKAKVLERRQEYPNIPVVPISFASSELGIKEWKFLMGAANNSALYIKQFNNLLRSLREDITLANLENAIATTKLLSAAQKELATMRLSLAKEFINDAVELKQLLKPGRLLLVDLRDEFIEKDDALSIFVVMLNIFAAARQEDGSTFNKFIVFDEAHKYMANKSLTNVIVETIREMRHKGISLMIASQDPPSLPTEIIELSTILLAHRFNSPQWLKHIQKALIHLAHLTPEEMAGLKQGEAFFWTSKSNDPKFTHRAVKIKTRPRVTQHGGATLTAGGKK